MRQTHRLGLAALALSLAAIGLSGCEEGETVSSAGEDEVQFTPLISSKDVDLEKLEEAAAESCRCTRAGGDEDACYEDFNAQSAAIEKSIFGDQPHEPITGFGTACAPISTEGFCLPFSDGDYCIGTGYSVNGASPRRGYMPVLCSQEEAQAVEEAYNAAIERVMTQSGLPVRPNFDELTKEESERWYEVSRRADIAGKTAIDALIDRIYAGEPVSPAGRGGGCTS